MSATTALDAASRTMAKPKKWMTKAFSGSHGQFKAKAKAAGESTREFAEEKKSSPELVGKQARLALVGMNSSHRAKHSLYKD